MRSERLQSLHELRVAALNGFKRRQPALAFRRQRRRNQRHPRSKIAAIQRTPEQLPRTGRDDSMWIAQKQIRAHATELFEREQPELVQPVVDQGTAFRLRRQHCHEAHKVARKTGPQPSCDFSGGLRIRLLHPKRVGLHGALHVQAFQDGGDDLHVFGSRSADIDFTLGDGSDNRPTARFDVVAPQSMLGAVQRSAAFNADSRRARTGYADAEFGEELAELDDVRLARGMTDF